ncbi:bifunctional [glutamine synthetase] adenylyltransferase/[glutamine synthetase]-adenylyl-L-tyrosine phosphorylase [Sneathiella limimaris]|uniref:bifunctional [glutamine synthetase] adenylyltransferase/[glutamine synthetase]-adenylyl-L-tyrosine phosphorylase n=1 Tax=Sneathiella limimaris TaxID=1964213 RepID=UPI00146CBEAD|nr:bifunctional [glutamine synthetase] adenylyltransferase/[glutamine synthetase]-adenylyl-L-tyrosine phosphorylase [Sneathiella limimaris]
MSADKNFAFFSEIVSLPNAAHEEQLSLGLENWAEKAASDPELDMFAQQLGKSVEGSALLAALFGNSPFLSQCLIKEANFFKLLITEGSEAAYTAIFERIDAEASADVDEVTIMSVLRSAKRQIALLTAICDIGGAWPLPQITKTLSDFASEAVNRCVGHLLFKAHEKGELSLPFPEEPTRDCGLIILGMGKLGAYELNYSSDIDLIVLFDRDKVNYTGRKFMEDFFLRLTKSMIRMMQERTKDGYVFRTDLRLRPDPGATPLALPLAAAHTYYESQGQNWERAAMIKARPIAGDLMAGKEFIEFLRPFVWRKFLDFAAIADIQAIKSQIHTHKGFGEICLDGHNIKIGRGGIREIEFFCQTQQLIEGGRDLDLRTAGTQATLDALVDTGKTQPEVRDDLQKAYVFLRTLEHRLQMINDEQTQLLPSEPDELNALGIFMGYSDPAEFRSELEQTLNTVKGHYDRLFQFEKNEERTVGRLVFTGSENDPETLNSLAELGYQDTESICQLVREWHHGRYRATRTVRAQQLLTALMPTILEELSRTANPDAAFTRFDSFLRKLPAGVQLFSLFTAHPSLLKLVAKIMGMAPELADRLAGNPLLLDGVLSSDFMGPIPSREELEEELDQLLATARDFQDVLDISRRWLNDLKFQVGVQILDNIDHGNPLGPTTNAGNGLTLIAEVVMSRLLPKVEKELSDKHGSVPGGRFAVIAAGKLGSQEMTPRSDADLIFVYDLEQEDVETTGAKPISPGLYYTRLAQRFINGLSALTGEGYLYEVDMRLRPHGKAGPLALPLEGFNSYYMNDAWTWELLALTRARPIVGDESLLVDVQKELQTIIGQDRDPQTLSTDLLDMQERIYAANSGVSIWALKHHPGGLMDLEFICQYLKLKDCHKHPDILVPNTIEALSKLKEKDLIERSDADTLIDAMSFYLNLQGLIRLSLKDRIVTDEIPAALKDALAEAGNVESFEELNVKVEKTEQAVTRIFRKLIGEKPAEA